MNIDEESGAHCSGNASLRCIHDDGEAIAMSHRYKLGYFLKVGSFENIIPGSPHRDAPRAAGKEGYLQIRTGRSRAGF